MSRAVAAVVLFTATALAFELQLVERDAYLMGTRASLSTYASDRHSGLAVLDTALATLERTEQQLSTWRPDSAISQLNRTPVGEPWKAGNGLCELFADLFAWQSTTGAAFDPAVGALTGAWQIHESGRVPDDVSLSDARRRSGLHHMSFDRQQCLVTRKADATIDVGAFGKGEALDRARRALSGRAWMIDLGGQVAVGGTTPDRTPWIIPVAHPTKRATPIMRVRLTAGSLSTSGGSERDLQVGSTRVGHLLDPRTGRPAPFTGAVVVWHDRALVADILSTALYVMGPDAGLAWATARGFAAAYLVPDDGSIRVAATPDFTARLKPDLIH